MCPWAVLAHDVNPARAGMILSLMLLMRFSPCKPRASGDDPVDKPGKHEKEK